MAAKSLKNTDYLISCPVCQDRFDNPRILPTCGHQFCLGCLERIDQLNIDDNDDIHLRCPVCREISVVREGVGLSNLPHPVLMNEVQEMLQDYMKTSSARYLLCDICEKPDVKATMFCVDCQDKMCDVCFKEHQENATLVKHQTIPACVELFCEEHDKIIIDYCKTCKLSICRICIRKDHKSHEIGPLDAVADEFREKLGHFLEENREMQQTQPDIPMIVKKKIRVAAEYDHMKVSLDRAYKLFKSVLSTITSYRFLIKSVRHANNANMNGYIAKMNYLSRERNDNICTTEMLRSNGSNLEVIARAEDILERPMNRDPPAPTLHQAEFPNEYDEAFLATANAVKYSFSESPPNSPIEFDSYLESNIQDIKEKERSVAGGFTSIVSDQLSMKLVSSEVVGASVVIWDVLFIKEPPLMVLRMRAFDPITAYDLDGQLSYSVGKECSDLMESGYLAFDSKRHMYLATSVDEGGLHLVPANGTAPTKLAFIEGKLTSCVSYLEGSDLYVISDKPEEKFKSSKIYVYSAQTDSVIKQFDHRSDICNLCTYMDANNKHFIATCPKDRHHVYLYDVEDDKEICRPNPKCLGNGHGDGIGELCSPAYITTVAPGQLLVYDSGNMSLVSFNILANPFETFSDSLSLTCGQIMMEDISSECPLSIAVNTDQKNFALASGNLINTYSYQ